MCENRKKKEVVNFELGQKTKREDETKNEEKEEKKEEEEEKEEGCFLFYCTKVVIWMRA